MKKNKFKGKVTNTGYLNDSPDKNNDFNIIPSGDITMKNVSQNIFGIDNLGNVKIMTPGNEYKFPGDEVLEIPMGQAGMLVKVDTPIKNNRLKETPTASSFMKVIENASKMPYAPYLPDKNVNVVDKRTIRATTGKPIIPNRDLKTGKYSYNNIVQTIKAARQEGVDPYTLLAIALAETGIGKADNNVGHVLGSQNYTGDAFVDMAKTFKFKLSEADRLGIKKEVNRIQVYNGTKRLYPDTEKDYDGGGDRYGVKIPKSGLSMKKNPLYGKEIINLRDSVLKQSPDIQSLVNTYQQGGFTDYNKFARIVQPYDGPNRVILPENPDLIPAENPIPQAVQKQLSKDSINKEKQQIALRKQAKKVSTTKKGKFTFPNGDTKEYSKMDPREKSYVQGVSLEGKGRFFENENSFIDEYLNPFNLVGQMSGNLAKSSWEARETNSNMPYVSAVGMPLLMGRIVGSGSINPLSSKMWTNVVPKKEFVNTLINPLAGNFKSVSKNIDNLGNKYLPNAYKANPLAVKENNEMFLYRARPIGQNPNMNMAAQLKAKEAAGEPLKWYQKNLLNPQTNPEIIAREKYYGRWFEKNPERLDFYIDPGRRNFADEETIEILRTKLPKSEANKFNVGNFEDAKRLTLSPETEFILPKEMVNSAERFPENYWQELIKQDKAFNTPHWLKGYKQIDVPKQQFKSEIDWSKWNKEIPDNTALMKEYNAIERTSKADGTWMKNPDGSAFRGTPEQFVQQNSDNFKKAFPNPILDEAGNIQTNYHGSPYKFEEFKPALKPTDKTGERLGSGIYTTPKRTKALEYAIKNQNKKGTLYELYQNANNKQTAIQDIDDYITTKIEKIKSDFLNKKISNQKANELYDAALKENDKLWDKIPDSEFKLQKGKDYLRIDDEQIVPFNNYPKSTIGNNGMFDMTNPNMYKALVPAIGVGAAAKSLNEKQKGGTVNPIYTQNPNDPRLRAYQDSLSLYNKADANIQKLNNFANKYNLKRSPVIDDGYFALEHKNIAPIGTDGLKWIEDKNTHKNIGLDTKDKKINYNVLAEATKLFNTLNPNSNYGGRLPIYKKPVQPVIYQERPKDIVTPISAMNTNVDYSKPQGQEIDWNFERVYKQGRPLYNKTEQHPNGVMMAQYDPQTLEYWPVNNPVNPGYEMTPQDLNKFRGELGTLNPSVPFTEKLNVRKKPIKKPKPISKNDGGPQLMMTMDKMEQGGPVGEQLPPEMVAISNVLNQRNKDLNWVNRGLNPQGQPFLLDNKGNQMTHKLSYADDDNGYFVYPNIIQNENGKLQDLNPKKALGWALKSNTAMRVPSQKVADFYSRQGLIKHQQGGLGNIGDELDLSKDQINYYKSLGYEFE